MVVQNLAAREFTLRGGTASLDLPGGLSLAPTSDAAAGERRAPGHPGRRQRGHAAGSSAATARAPTSRAPATPRRSTRSTSRSRSRRASPSRSSVYGASAMQIVVDTDDRFDDRYPGHVRVGIKNTSPATISNAALQIPVEGAAGLRRPAASSAREWAAASIAPGETWFPDAAGDPDDDFIIVPRADGRREPRARASSRRPRARAPTDRHRPHQAPAGAARARARPTLDGQAPRRVDRARSGRAGAGATGYQVYGAPNRKTRVRRTPLPTLDAQTPARRATRSPPAHQGARARRGREGDRALHGHGRPARAAPPDGRGDRRHDAATRRSRSTTSRSFCAAQRRRPAGQAYDPDFDFSVDRGRGHGSRSRKPVTGNDVTTTIAVGTLPGVGDRHGAHRHARHLAVGGEPPEDDDHASPAAATPTATATCAPRSWATPTSPARAPTATCRAPTSTASRQNLCHRSPASWAAQLASHGRVGAALVRPRVHADPAGRRLDRVPGLQRRDRPRTSRASRNDGDRMPAAGQAQRRGVGDHRPRVHVDRRQRRAVSAT